MIQSWKKNRWSLVAGGSVVVFLAALLWPIGLPPLSEVSSIKITDRNGMLLREVFSPASGRGTMVSIDQVSPEYRAALLATEDKRFYSHFGIDPLAVAHAAAANIRAGKIVRGGSTITQQLVRALHPRPRNFLSKAAEAWEAVRTDLYHGKREILEQYVNRISFGNNNFGIEAASRFYLGKSSKFLTWSEAAFLVGIPNNPTVRNPFSSSPGVQKKRHRKILDKLLAVGFLDSTGHARAIAQFPRLMLHHDVVKAPHFTNYVLACGGFKGPTVRTSIDLSLQQASEDIVRQWVSLCAPYNVTNASAVVVDNGTGEILAYIGSGDFWDADHDGEVDGVISYRQPGSALKPFTYALALANGFTAASVLPDIATHLPAPGGDFVPRNYDRTFHGPVRLRTALGCSYNVPAVRVASRIGVDKLLKFLRECGFSGLTRPSTEYGLGLTLGNGEATLLQLARAYALFPRTGRPLSLRWIIDGSDSSGTSQPDTEKVMPAAVAAIIGDILADHDARAPAFGNPSVLDMPFRCGVKTGTTKDYKDNWTVGFAGRFTVAVWVGNFDGSPMHNVSGVAGAGPIFHEIMQAIEKRYGTPRPYDAPEGVVRRKICPLSGEKPGPWCEGAIEELFIWGSEPKATCRYHSESGIAYPPEYALWAKECGKEAEAGEKSAAIPKGSKLRIVYPDNASVFAIDPVLDTAFQTLSISILAPQSSAVTVYVDGKKHATVRAPYTCRWRLQKGEHTIRACETGDTAISDRISFKVL
jgi:penicillin-binding protein 1C